MLIGGIFHIVVLYISQLKNTLQKVKKEKYLYESYSLYQN